MQTWLQGTDGAGGIAGLMLGPTGFWGRSKEGAKAAIWAHTTDLQAACGGRQQVGEQPAGDPYGTPSQSKSSGY